MHYLDYHEQRQHRTGDFPLAFYHVDRNFVRYQMATHWHKETEIIRILSGRLKIYVDDREIMAEAGDLITLGSGVIHGADPEDCVYECIVFDPEALTPAVESCKQELQGILRQTIFLKSGDIAADAEYVSAIERLFMLAGMDFLGHIMELLSAVHGFIGGHLRNLGAAQLHTVSERTWQRAEQLKPALEYIEKHYGSHISLETLARLTGFSPKYFCRYFRTIVHRSPIDYLNYYRIERAAQLLTGADMNVAEVAVHCGYADSSAFIKQFRKYKGTTPKQYKLHVCHSDQTKA